MMRDQKDYVACTKCSGLSYPTVADIDIDNIHVATEGYVCELCGELYMNQEQMHVLIKRFDMKRANIKKDDKIVNIEDLAGFSTVEGEKETT